MPPGSRRAFRLKWAEVHQSMGVRLYTRCLLRNAIVGHLKIVV